jgi:hypothetical protein
MQSERLRNGHPTDVNRQQRHFHLMMKQPQVASELVNPAPHLRQLGAHLQNILYPRSASQNRQVLCFFGSGIAQSRLLIHGFARHIMRFDSILLHGLRYLANLCSGLVKIFARNAHPDLRRPGPFVAAALVRTHHKPGKMRG